MSLTCAKPVLSATSLVAPDKHVLALTKAFRSVVVIRVSHANHVLSSLGFMMSPSVCCLYKRAANCGVVRPRLTHTVESATRILHVFVSETAVLNPAMRL